MKVQTVYRPGGAYAGPADSLREAARKMRVSGQGCLPVLDGSHVTGIVTERDLAESVANGVPPSEGSVFDYTTDGSVTVSLNDDCEVAELKMLAIGCRNLPVVDGDRLVGTISMRDVVLKAAAKTRPRSGDLGHPLDRTRDDWPDEPQPDVDTQP